MLVSCWLRMSVGVEVEVECEVGEVVGEVGCCRGIVKLEFHLA